VGIFGTHLNAAAFQSIIEPMARIPTDWQVYTEFNSFFYINQNPTPSNSQAFSYWVYTGEEIQNYVNGDKSVIDKALYSSP
jgi:hypothetical protein